MNTATVIYQLVKRVHNDMEASGGEGYTTWEIDFVQDLLDREEDGAIYTTQRQRDKLQEIYEEKTCS